MLAGMLEAASVDAAAAAAATVLRLLLLPSPLLCSPDSSALALPSREPEAVEAWDGDTLLLLLLLLMLMLPVLRVGEVSLLAPGASGGCCGGGSGGAAAAPLPCRGEVLGRVGSAARAATRTLDGRVGCAAAAAASPALRTGKGGGRGRERKGAPLRLERREGITA
jgi:hypothetical protein